MDMQAAIRAVTEHRDLSEAQMETVMRLVMTGQATPAQIGGLLIGLRMKGETVDEIAAAARVMRGLASRVELDKKYLVDTCGTGGDGARTFNISTASAFVVAAAGGRVAKHGNRSVSSACGSADVLEAAGVRLDLTPEQVAACVDQIGVGFMFAPLHHNAMKFAIGPRREMGVRTLFNLLGPLTNPAGAPNQVIGVYDARWLRPVAQVMGKLGSRHVLVVHSSEGMDEIGIGGVTNIAEMRDGDVTSYEVRPEDFGLASAPMETLKVSGPKDSLDLVLGVLSGVPGPASDVVALNAGAAIYVAGLAATLAEGIARAREVIANGEARIRLDELARFTQAL
ncbi:MAG: anthranilate phosphoribosyltransferase [Chromatiales bacterium]|jgi:anthranilate phosphoribosyltransferase|nr:anthranilate phosphoribosyltransferase [Chromatiales bacterium]